MSTPISDFELLVVISGFKIIISLSGVSINLGNVDGTKSRGKSRERYYVLLVLFGVGDFMALLAPDMEETSSLFW